MDMFFRSESGSWSRKQKKRVKEQRNNSERRMASGTGDTDNKTHSETEGLARSWALTTKHAAGGCCHPGLTDPMPREDERD